jgi:murein DD-endopeptidase MepM/ murein hydrolase activator NlpD
MRVSLLPFLIRMLPLAVAPLLLSACDATWPGPGRTIASAPAPARCASPVAVMAGDTVYSVARRCGVSVRELIEANGLQPPYALGSGMSLRVPGEGAEHVVQRGETLSVLARRYRVDFQSLASLNNKQPPYPIRVGEHLRVPAAYGTNTVATARPTAPPSGSELGPIIVSSPNAVARHDPVVSAVRPQPIRPSAVMAPAVAALAPQAPSPSPEPAVPQVAPVAATVPAVVPPEPVAVSGRGFLWPVKGDLLVEFGPQAAKGQNNDGINIAAAAGTPVHAAENGVVAYVGNGLKGFGNLILVKHADGWMTAYAHTDQVTIRRGEPVRRGQSIATVGSTGSVTSPQLHFEIRHGTEAVNPADYLKDGPVS